MKNKIWITDYYLHNTNDIIYFRRNAGIQR